MAEAERKPDADAEAEAAATRAYFERVHRDASRSAGTTLLWSSLLAAFPGLVLFLIGWRFGDLELLIFGCIGLAVAAVLALVGLWKRLRH